MAAYSRKQYSGAASPTTTTSTLTNVGTSVTLLATTGWPSIAGIPFYVAIEAGTANEEKCLATISGSTLTLTRAQDDTTAVAHAIGSSIYPVFSANDADEANELVSKLTTKGDLLVTDGSGLFRLGVGANGYFLKANSSASVGVEWASIPTINNLDDVGDVAISSIEDNDFLVYNSSASAWVNETVHFLTVSDTAPSDEVQEGDLWYNSNELEMYIRYSSTWQQVTLSEEFPKVEELDNAYIDTPTTNDVLAFDGADWYNVQIMDILTLSLSDISDIDASAAEVNILDGATLSTTELNYVDGVTSAIQTQLNNKAPLASPTFTGTVTLPNNTVTLGTQTTGNYMSDLTQGTGVTITHTPGEGSNATIAIGQAVGTSASVTFVNVTVTGDLTVSGTTTSINTETLTVDDNIIVLNNNATGAPSQNAGIEVERGSSTNVALRWNETSDKWELTTDGSAYADIATETYAASLTPGDSDDVTEGTTNLYFTDGRARTALLADNAGTASGIRFIAPNTGTVELISQEATRFVRVTSNAASGGGKTEIQGSAQILASSSISDPGHLTVAGSVFVGGGVAFEGDTANDYETTLVATDPTADRTITLPNADGTVALNGSIALGTDTTGNYMSDLTQGTGVTITHTPSEGSNATIAIGQAVGTSASVTFADVTATGNVSISGRIDKTTVRESVADVSVSASVVTADYSTGDIFYVGTAPASNFTVNLTNAPTDNGKAITVVLFVTQGATGFYPNVVQVAGSAQTIKWANGAAPTPTSSTGKIDIFSFTFVRRSSAWTVFGSSNLGY